MHEITEQQNVTPIDVHEHAAIYTVQYVTAGFYSIDNLYSP